MTRRLGAAWCPPPLRACLAALLLLGCSDQAAPDAETAPGEWAYGRAMRLAATDDGALELRDTADATATFALAARGPVARTFTATRNGVGALSYVHSDVVDDVLEASPPQIAADGSSAQQAFTSATTDRKALLTAQTDGAHGTVFTLQLTGKADSVAIPVRCDAAATFFGFGEQYNGVEQRGEAFDLLVNEQGNGRDGSGGISVGDAHTTYFPMPSWLDARGFGVHFDGYRRVRVDLCKTDADVAWIEVVGPGPVVWRVLHGPTPLAVVRQLGDLLGRPKPPPSWAWGLWIGVQGGRDKVLAEADALEAADIPTAALWVQDWGGIRKNLDGGFGVQYVWKPDELLVGAGETPLYPDFAGLVQSLHARGYKFLAYANPFIPKQIQSDRFEAMAAGGMLVKNADGSVYEDALVPNLPQIDGHPDFGNPATVPYVSGELAAIIRNWGVDGWMHDFGEWVPPDGHHHDGSDPIERRNSFPVDWNRAARLAADAERPDGDFAWIARSGHSGVQRFAQIHWVGDQETNWSELDGLPTVVPALLNLGFAGQPFVTHDIAGFAKGTPSTKELWMRWTELGAFTPVMRTHEGADKTNNWNWDRDAETTAHFRRYVAVHCALRPTFAALAAEAAVSSAPLLRAMVLAYPDDAEARSRSDQFLIGEDLLVAPVLKPGATERSFYLPAGVWYDVWTGEKLQGGKTVSRPAPLGTIPVFSRGRDRSDLRDAESTLDAAHCRG